MRLAPAIYKRVNPFFKQYGFTKKGGMYYRIENDIAFCITFEFPSYARVWCHILPLYMPTSFAHLTYGQDLTQVYRRLSCVLCKLVDNSEEMIDSWCLDVTEICRKFVFPFFESVSTPEKLLDCCVAIKSSPQLFLPFAGKFTFLLEGYTCLYLGKDLKAGNAFRKYKKAVQSIPYITPDAVKKKMAELEHLKKLKTLSRQERANFFQNICEETMQTCFPPKKKNNSVFFDFDSMLFRA